MGLKSRLKREKREALEAAVLAEREACAQYIEREGWHNDECPVAQGHAWYACDCEMRHMAAGIRARGA